MMKINSLVLGCVVALTTTYGALAAEFTKGTVKTVDVDAMKVTLIHDELKDLEMPAMTMVFRVQDPAMLDKLKPGVDIEFVAERVDGKLTVAQVK